MAAVPSGARNPPEAGSSPEVGLGLARKPTGPSPEVGLAVAAARMEEVALLPPEVEEGAREYKLRFTAKPGTARFEQLVTQMRWRIRESGEEGMAVYSLGVADDGRPLGLSPAEMSDSLTTLRALCAEADATVLTVQELPAASSGKSVCHVQIAPSLATVARAKRGIACCALGSRECSGTTTLVAALVHGVRDDGDGGARLAVLRHRHEVECGRSLSVVTHEVEEEHCVLRTKRVAFRITDAPFKQDGARRWNVLLGTKPQLCLVVLAATDALAGKVDGARELLGLLHTLRQPHILVVTKVDCAPNRQVIVSALQDLGAVLASDAVTAQAALHTGKVPALLTSAVSFENVSELLEFIAAFAKVRDCESSRSTAAPADYTEGKLFEVERVIVRDRQLIVCGTCQLGSIAVGDSLSISNGGEGPACVVSVASIHRMKRPVGQLLEGDAGSVCVGPADRITSRLKRLAFLSAGIAAVTANSVYLTGIRGAARLPEGNFTAQLFVGWQRCVVNCRRVADHEDQLQADCLPLPLTLFHGRSPIVGLLTIGTSALPCAVEIASR